MRSGVRLGTTGTVIRVGFDQLATDDMIIVYYANDIDVSLENDAEPDICRLRGEREVFDDEHAPATTRAGSWQQTPADLEAQTRR